MRVIITEEGRQCTKCGEEKPWDDFYRKSNGFNGRASECEDCRRSYQATVRERRTVYSRAWRAANRDKTHRYGMKQSYGLLHGEYDRMLAEQNGNCAACGQPETLIANGLPRRLSVDHDHDTGVVRGLLCNACNRAIGAAREDVERLLGCVRYLRRSSSES